MRVGEALAGGARGRPPRACPSARRGRATSRSSRASARRGPSSASTTVTSTPERAQTSAIPEPMSPPPTTPTRMGRDASGCGSGGGGEGRRGDDADAVAQVRRAREHIRPAPRSAAACRASVAASSRSSRCCATRRLVPVRVDVDHVVHASVSDDVGRLHGRSRYLCARYLAAGRAAAEVSPSRKVRTSQGRVVGNADPGKPAGKCHRKHTADVRGSQLQSRAGKVEMVR